MKSQRSHVLAENNPVGPIHAKECCCILTRLGHDGFRRQAGGERGTAIGAGMEDGMRNRIGD